MKAIYLLALTIFIFVSNIALAQSDENKDTKDSTIVVQSNADREILNRPVEYYDFYTYRLAPNAKDTILAVRKPTSFWYGIFGGPNFDYTLGDLFSKQRPDAPIDGIENQVVDFHNTLGYGYFIGAMAEYTPIDSYFGFGLKVAAFDKYIANSPSDAMGRFNVEYNMYSNVTYLTLSPFARYTIPKLGGLYLSGGIDVAINTGSEFTQTSNFENTGDIDHVYNIYPIDPKTRYGISLGLGYDFFMADFFSGNNRVRFTPFVDLRAATDMVTSYSSNWSDVGIRVGVQLKLSHDKVLYDTLEYKYEERGPVLAATIQNEVGIEYPGFVSVGEAPMINLSTVTLPPAEDTTALEPPAPVEVAVKMGTPQEVETTTAIETKTAVKYDSPLVLNYATSTSAQLTDAMKTELDAVAKFLKENPNAIVRLEGHSDNRGSRDENESRARARAQTAMNYLMRQGIPQGRIFANSRGSLVPVAENDTEAGRRKNRRLEILIQRSR